MEKDYCVDCAKHTATTITNKEFDVDKKVGLVAYDGVCQICGRFKYHFELGHIEQ